METTRFIHGILKLGHKLGLHYSESFMLQNSLEPTKTIEKQINIINHHFNTSIEAVSAHEAEGFPPSMKFDLPDNVENAYSKKFVEDRKYISDSAMFWREDCFCKNFSKYDKMQILILPIWWHEEKKSRKEIMELLLDGEYDEYTSNVKMAIEKHEKHAYNCKHHIDD